jgi:thiol:disulfide interchange protein
MKKLIMLIIPFCILASAVAAEKQTAGINWLDNLDKGLALAKTSNKPVMVDFYADWCGWCKKLDKTTYSDPRVIDGSAGFVCVKVNTDTADGKYSTKYGVQGLPTIVFLSSKGEVLDKVVGYSDAESFYLTMKKIFSPAAKDKTK